jgi:hypothetical protein
MPRAPAPGIFDGLVQLADLNVSVADPILFPDGTIRSFEAKARRHERHGRSPFSRPEIYQDRHFVEVEAIRQIADIQGAKTVGQVMGFRLWTARFCARHFGRNCNGRPTISGDSGGRAAIYGRVE